MTDATARSSRLRLDPASVQKALDAEAIRTLIARYCHLRDDWALEEMAELFTPDGELGGKATSAVGREAIAALVASGVNRSAEQGVVGTPMKHVVFNTELEIDGDQATALSDVMGVTYEGGRFAIVEAARYRDELVRLDGRWYFARKEPFGFFTEGDAG